MNLFSLKTVKVAMLLFITTSSLFGQTPDSTVLTSSITEALTGKSREGAGQVVVITGARFSYELVEKWIDAYSTAHPEVQIIIESRGSNDPLKYEILAEVFEQEDEIKKHREYIKIGRYAVLPVANSGSAFARNYSEKGLNTDLINQVFFHNIFAQKEKSQTISSPFTNYTRLQKAGVPKVFASYFGHEQKDLKGIAVAGADAHLLKAVLRDSAGVTYLPIPIIYNEQTRKPVDGLTVLPVDLNGNKKVSEDEKLYDNLDNVLKRLEAEAPSKIKNVPIEYLHLSVDKRHASSEAIEFLKWVNEHGQVYLHQFGYLQAEPDEARNADFSEFATRASGASEGSQNK